MSSTPTSTPTTSAAPASWPSAPGRRSTCRRRTGGATPSRPMRDGDVLAIGSSRILALRTPGTPWRARAICSMMRALFTGDTLFLAGVGRPDLEASPEQARERARLLHASLRAPDGAATRDARPARAHQRAGAVRRAADRGDAGRGHRAGSRCWAWPRTRSWTAILARIPPTPPNHAQIVALNEAGELPDGDPTDLEAGANRCAVS